MRQEAKLTLSEYVNDPQEPPALCNLRESVSKGARAEETAILKTGNTKPGERQIEKKQVGVLGRQGLHHHLNIYNA